MISLLTLLQTKISRDEANILKYGLGNSIQQKRLSWTYVFVHCDLIHRYLTEELKSRDHESSLRSNLSYLANSYYNNVKTDKNSSEKTRNPQKTEK